MNSINPKVHLNRFNKGIEHLFLLNRTGRYTALEGLRGLAVLMVFSVHLFSYYDNPYFVSSKYYITRNIIKFLHSGQIGVDLFFVLSGFFIAVNLAKKRPLFIEFILRRFHRLLPAHLLIQIYLITKYNITSLAVILSNLFFINILFKNINTINIVTWSLGYEIVFYLMYGAWNIFFRKTKEMHSVYAFVAVFLGLWSCQWWGPSIISLVSGDSLVLPGMYRFTGFLWGIGLAKLYMSEKWWPKLKPFLSQCMIPALLFLILLQWNWEWGRQHKEYYFLAVDIMFFLITASLITGKNNLCNFFSWNPLRLIGVISYSFYLSHPIFITISLELAKKYDGFLKLGIHLLLAFGITLIASCMMFLLLERSYFTGQSQLVRVILWVIRKLRHKETVRA